ncbi:MAG: stage II sporulation protein D [Bacilli bacterium]|nr:stage II sporulation protein D [Bacilli bacterium]
MRNKLLLLVVVVLSPFAVISFFKSKETNFYLVEKEIYLKDYEKKMPLNDYVIGVVAAEMPALFHEEALKAQSVVARTFALYQMEHKGYVTLGDQAYITEEDMHKKWQDKYDIYYQKIKDAVNATGNICIYYQNNLIKAYYFSLSNGSTEDAISVFNESYDYIKPVDTSFDVDNKNFIHNYNFNESDFKSLLNINSINNIKIVKDEQNYVSKVIIDDHEFSGINIRKILNLKSASFDISKNNNEILITTYGYGHGVGLSQNGANYLANQGYSYQDIIKYFYQNITLKDYNV